jgi:hypothetical protein
MVFVQGWPHIGATQKHKNLELVTMKKDDKNLAKLKRDYLNLVLKISKLRSKGEEPPFGLIMQAQDIGRLAHISEHQIDKLLFG